VIVFCSLLFMVCCLWFVVCGCLLLWWSSFLRQDDKFWGRLERNVGGNMCLCFVVSGLCLVSGCLLSLWRSFLRQDDKFGGRLEVICVCG
jgi:hypothetical protein